MLQTKNILAMQKDKALLASVSLNIANESALLHLEVLLHESKRASS